MPLVLSGVYFYFFVDVFDNLLYRKNFVVHCVLLIVKVESLFEDEDFRTKVTREQFEDLCQDLVDRVDKVIKDALATAELTAVCCIVLSVC